MPECFGQVVSLHGVHLGLDFHCVYLSNHSSQAHQTLYEGT